MPTEWYNGGYWDGLPVRRLAHVAADLVREARRRRDGVLATLSDDPADYDGLPVSTMSQVAQDVLEWLRSECTDYVYPDLFEDVEYPDAAWAYFQGEDSTDIVTEEYLGIDGLEIDGQRMTGQIWHILRRAIERLRWQIRVDTDPPQDRTSNSPFVNDNYLFYVLNLDAATVDEAATVLNANAWPSSGTYTDGLPSLAVSWIPGTYGWNAITQKAMMTADIFKVKIKPADLDYYDEIVEVGVAYYSASPFLPIEFYADSEGPLVPGETRALYWLGAPSGVITCEPSYTDSAPVTFSVKRVGDTGVLTRTGSRVDARIALLLLRDMEGSAS